MDEWTDNRTNESKRNPEKESITKTETYKEAYHNLFFLKKKEKRNVNENVCVREEKQKTR